ncbi:MAG: efflux RND transporter periplasmic adaptor subunit [Acidobacteriota bacterium]
MATRQASTGHDLGSLKIDERARQKRSPLRRALIYVAILAALVVAAGLFFAFNNRKPAVDVVLVENPENQQVVLLNANGYVTPRRRATIAAKITGQVTAVYAEEGMRVRAGQVLARLDDSDARVRLQSARAERDASAATIADLEVNLANAERELTRTKGLQAAGVRSVEALDQAQTAVDSLKARLALARKQVDAADAQIRVAQQDLDNCTVRSPFDGLVVSKDAQVGEMVSPISAGGGFTRTGIATVVDMKSLEIEVDVNESNIALVKPGQAVVANLDAYPNWDIPARVRTIIPTADRQKATVKVRISFIKLDPRILPDMGIKVAFLEQRAAKGKSDVVALIPSEAVRQDNGEPAVFVVRDGKVEERAVSLGRKRGTRIEVLAGIAQGESLVVRGPADLHSGQDVEINR